MIVFGCCMDTPICMLLSSSSSNSCLYCGVIKYPAPVFLDADRVFDALPSTNSTISFSGVSGANSRISASCIALMTLFLCIHHPQQKHADHALVNVNNKTNQSLKSYVFKFHLENGTLTCPSSPTILLPNAALSAFSSHSLLTRTDITVPALLP